MINYLGGTKASANIRNSLQLELLTGTWCNPLISLQVIRNINTFARTKTLAQGFLDMALFTANASQMKHLLQQGPDTPFYYFLITLLVSLFDGLF